MGGKKATFDEVEYVQQLVERIVSECPQRQATSADERRAHELMQAELDGWGLSGDLEPFRYNDSVYANAALHFGLGTAGSVVSGVLPLVGFALHLAAGTSYFLDSHHRIPFLRRVFPFKPSQNLVVTLPAEGSPALRVVFLAHIDAAFTGLMFNPRVVRAMNPLKLPKPLRFLGRSMAFVTYSQFVLAGFDLLRAVLGPLALPLRPVEVMLTMPTLLAFLMSLDVVRRNEIVPGASDDLSGVAGMAILARRLAKTKPAEVELVFVTTGAEEAGLGGAQALAQARTEQWDKSNTVVLALDGLSGGELCYYEEGEIHKRPVPEWLKGLLAEVAASDPRFASVRGFDATIGGTDVLAFRARGYDGVGIGRVDRKLGAPLNYHLPSDTPANLNARHIVEAVDFTELLVSKLIDRRATATPTSSSR